MFSSTPVSSSNFIILQTNPYPHPQPQPLPHPHPSHPPQIFPHSIDNNNSNSNCNSSILRTNEVKHARTPAAPAQQVHQIQIHHSPQLPIPSPNYPSNDRIDEKAANTNANTNANANTNESSFIPNRQVPILNNNYLPINNGGINHNNNHFQNADITSQINGRTIHNKHCGSLNINMINDNNNKNCVYSDNELFSHVTNNNINNNNNKQSEQLLEQSEQSKQQVISDNNIKTTKSDETRDYESLITVNEIVNTNLYSNLTNIIVTTIASTAATTTTTHTISAGNITSTGFDEDSPLPLSLPLSLPLPLNNNTHQPQSFTVLNVPVPRSSKPLVSKLDLAAARRRNRRLKRLQTTKNTNCANANCKEGGDTDSSVATSSDSDDGGGDSDDEFHHVDLWIRSGPPDKPDYKPKKVDFLKIFGLTTPSTKNEVELAKLERRPWLPPWKTMQIDDARRKSTFHLPYPASHPSLLNRTIDFGAKVHFLSGLGLRTVPDRSRDEYETIWQKIISNRRKRDGGDTPLTTYCIKAYKKMRKNILYTCRPITVELNQLPCLPHKVAARLPVQTHTQTHFFTNTNNSNSVENIPFLIRQQQQQTSSNNFTVQNIPNVKTRNFVNTNGLKRTFTEQNIIANVKRKTTINNEKVEEEEEEGSCSKTTEQNGQHKFKWPGVHVLMESYHRYSKERNIELHHLKSRCSYLCEQIRRRQTEADVLERKLRELRSLHIFHDQEKQQIQRCIDQLLTVPNIFR